LDARPISTSGYEAEALLFPDGHVEGFGGDTSRWATVDEFRASRQADAQGGW